MQERERQRLILGAYLLHLMTEANGGKEPRTIWHYRRIGKRFGVRIRVVPSDVLDGALLRHGQRTGLHGVIYIRRTHDMARFRREIIHELGESACYWEGVPAWVSQVSRHEAACACVGAYV